MPGGLNYESTCIHKYPTFYISLNLANFQPYKLNAD